MSNTSPVYARIDANLKENAEDILNKLGISPSNAIGMFYSQIVLNNGIPFELKLPVNNLFSISELTQEELNNELQKGINSIKNGQVYTKDEVDKILKKEFGI